MTQRKEGKKEAIDVATRIASAINTISVNSINILTPKFMNNLYSYRLCRALTFESMPFLERMRILFLLLFAATLCFSAENLSSQNRLVTISCAHASLKEVFNLIEQQTEYLFVYDENVPVGQDVSLEVSRKTVREVLDLLFAGRPLTYALEGNYIVLSHATAPARAEKRKIQGVVADAKGEPIIGANVTVKGTAIGTITDLEGKFTLEADDGRTLEISYIGYLTKAVSLQNKTFLSVTLEEDTQKLDEVVVIGYGQQRRSEITTAITRVSSDDFVKGSVKTPEQLIQGKVAGLQIVNPSGDPTAELQMMLRGVSTLSSSSSPLVVIDGIPGGVLNSIAPDDIESIDVLKDGSAAAIYGTRGTNGVIIVTTKKGTASRMSIDYSGYLSINTIKKGVDVLSAGEYKALKNDPQFLANQVNIVDYGDDVNYVDQILRVPVSHSHNLSMRGGSAASNYAASVTYRQHQGIILNSDRDQLNLKVSLNHAILNNKVKGSLNINSVTGSDDLVGERGVYVASIQRNPTIPVYHPDGSYVDEFGMPSNPVALLKEETRQKDWHRLLASGKITVAPLEGLSLAVMGALQRYDTEYNQARTKKHPVYAQNGTLPNAALSHTLNMDKTLEITGDYVKSIARHKFSAMLGYSYQDFSYKYAYMYADDLPSDLFGAWNIGTASSIKNGKATLDSFRDGSKLIAFFGRLTYNYDEKYFLMGSLRREGSSKFGTNNKWGLFPAVSAGWEIKKENFMQAAAFVDLLKLRAGFGVTGTMPKDPYLSLTQLDYDQITYTDGRWLQSVVPTSNPNPDLKWETKKEYNLGVDFSFFRRLSGSVDFYVRKTSDLLFNYPVPVPPNLVSTTWANVGKITNSGIELALNYEAIRNETFQWTVGGNFSYNKNKVNSLSNSLYQRDWVQVGDTEEPMKTYTHRLEEGQPVGNFYSWRYAGLTPEGKWLFYDQENHPVTADKVSEGDKAITGNGIPKINIGFNTSFYWKNFDLTVTARGSFLFQVLNRYDMRFTQAQHAKAGTNMTKKALQIPRNAQTYIWDSPVYSDFYIENGNFLKIDNLTLGYTFNLPKEFIKRLRVYVSGLNLFTFTSYSGLDPEVSLTGSSILDPGTAGSIEGRGEIYPTTRTFTFGINASF